MSFIGANELRPPRQRLEDCLAEGAPPSDGVSFNAKPRLLSYLEGLEKAGE
jgi:hypothetical protein